MSMEDFYAQLPRGKEDKPLLFGMGPLVYDFHDIDGLYYMLDRKLSGCMVMMWAKPMNGSIQGQVTLDGREISNVVLQYMPIMNNMWILGIPLRGLVTEYGRAYQLHVEGFVDEDGNEMNSRDFTVTGIEKVQPRQEDAEHEAIALQAAREGIVLLENKKHVLPLKKSMVLNLFGKGVHEFRIGAVGAGKINPRYSVNFVETIRQREDYMLNEELATFYGCDQDLIPSNEMLQRAVEKSDTAIMMITRAAGENQDSSSAKGEYYLSDEEEALLAKLSQTFAHTIVVLNVGYPIDVTFVQKYHVHGLIFLGLAGMLAGPALMDILSGDVNPSGRLTDTWAKDYFDIPAAKNFYDSADKPRLNAESSAYVDTCYEEDIYVGYRYFHTFHKRVAYPFGYGLSYTNFIIEPENIRFNGEELTLDIHVKNVGKTAGKEVVQLYVGKPNTVVETPEKELVEFYKTKELAPGEEEAFRFSVPKSHMTSYDEKLAAYVLAKGSYPIYLGNSVDAMMQGSFIIGVTEVIKQVENLMVPTQAITRLSQRDEEGSYPTGHMSGIQSDKMSFEPYASRKKYFMEPLAKTNTERRIIFADVQQDIHLTEAFVSQLSIEELARISVCASAGWGMEGIGEAGHIYQIEGRKLPSFPVSDGNSGVNLNMKNIGMPSGVTFASSFNRKLCQDVGRVIGEEAKAFGVPLILAPAINIHRNPLNGRQPEYFSEDPYLAGVLAGYYCKGMEAAGVGSCLKHLMANNCESARKRNQSIISERAIREIYFKPFEIAMEIHMPATFMTAYNAVNGQPTATDPELILGMLREENGFDGFVMTDWTSYDTADPVCMIEAGNCWLTPGSTDDTYTSQIVEGVRDGRIQLGRLQSNVMYLIRTLARFA